VTSVHVRVVAVEVLYAFLGVRREVWSAVLLSTVPEGVLCPVSRSHPAPVPHLLAGCRVR